jgi:hypothetical protein
MIMQIRNGASLYTSTEEHVGHVDQVVDEIHLGVGSTIFENLREYHG